MEEFLSRIVSNVHGLLVWYPVATAAVSIFFGLMWCFFGYRAFRVLLVVTGVLLGALFGYASAAASTPTVAAWVVGALLGGTIAGVVFGVFVNVGVLLMGMAYATVLALILFRMVGQLSEHTALFASLVVGLLGGLLALLLMRPMLVIYTSLTGALWVVATVVALIVAVPALEVPTMIGDVYSLNLEPFLMRFWPIIAGAAAVLFGAGVTFQFSWASPETDEKSDATESRRGKKPPRQAEAA